MKKTFLIILIAVLTNISAAVADVRVQINWTGELQITGFSTFPGFPMNLDNDPSTMTYQWTIDNGSSMTIASNAASCGQPAVTGSVVLIGAGPGGTDENLDISALLTVAQLLPTTGATVNFPPGVTPVFNASGTPVSTIPLQDAVLNLNSILDVNQVTFNGNVLIFEVKENVLAGTTPSSTLFTAEDTTKGNDGILTRPFTVNSILECLDSFVGQNATTTKTALELSGFTVTANQTEVSTTVAPGSVIRIIENEDGSLTLVIAKAPQPQSAAAIPTMSSFGLLLLTPLFALIVLFKSKRQRS